MARPKNTTILEQFREDLAAGCFDRLPFLPSERELAEHYQTGRGIIRSTLAALIGENRLIRIPRRGIRLNQTKGKSRFHRFLLKLHQPQQLRAFETSGLVAGLCEGATSLYAEAILSFAQIPLDGRELKERFDTGDLQGVIFLEQATPEDLHAVIAAGIPHLIANLEIPQNAICCRMDYRQIGRLAGQRLLRSGYRRFGVFAGPKERFIFREMLAGFRGALAEEEIPLPPEYIAEGERPDAVEKLRSLLQLPESRRPEAFFTMRDNRAELLYRITAELQLRIPEDVAVISYDDISWPAGEECGLTTVSQEVWQIGKRSVELLCQWYNTGVRPLDCIIPGRLMERSSIMPEQINVRHSEYQQQDFRKEKNGKDSDKKKQCEKSGEADPRGDHRPRHQSFGGVPDADAGSQVGFPHPRTQSRPGDDLQDPVSER